jgi:hypothetical protein
MAAGSSRNVSGSTSTSTACAPHSSTTLAVAGKVAQGTDNLVARPDLEREERDVERGGARRDDGGVGVPTASATAASSSSTSDPSSAGPLRTTSSTAASSSVSTSGRASRIGSLNVPPQIRNLRVQLPDRENP